MTMTTNRQRAFRPVNACANWVAGAVMVVCLVGVPGLAAAQQDVTARLHTDLRLSYEAAVQRFSAALKDEEVYRQQFEAAAAELDRNRASDEAFALFLAVTARINPEWEAARTEAEQYNLEMVRAYDTYYDALAGELSRLTGLLQSATTQSARTQLTQSVGMVNARLDALERERPGDQLQIIRTSVTPREPDPRDTPQQTAQKVRILNALIANTDSTIAQAEATRDRLETLVRGEDALARQQSGLTRFSTGVTAAGVPPTSGGASGASTPPPPGTEDFAALSPTEKLDRVRSLIEQLVLRRAEYQRQLSLFPAGGGGGL